MYDESNSRNKLSLILYYFCDIVIGTTDAKHLRYC